MGRLKVDTEAVYLPPRLRKLMKKTERYPLTVMEAPMGYGKTVALRKYLAEKQAAYIWMTAVDPSQDYFWNQFCALFSRLAQQKSLLLREAGFPETDFLAEQAAGWIAETAEMVEYPVIFVIDDYHKAASQKLNRFFEAVARNIENHGNIKNPKNTDHASSTDTVAHAAAGDAKNEISLLDVGNGENTIEVDINTGKENVRKSNVSGSIKTAGSTGGVMLRFILAGRSHFDSGREELQLKRRLFTITEKDFQLTEQECANYFELCGVRLTQPQADRLYSRTEGWVSALYLSVLRTQAEGAFAIEENMDRLFETSQYSGLTADQKDFLLRVSIFPEFTKEQARFVRRKADPSRILDKIVDMGGFIRYDRRTGVYHIHNLFASFLRGRLAEQRREYVREVFRNGADWYYLNRNYSQAAKCYYYSHDYNEMLKAFERDRAAGLSPADLRLMEDAFDACPASIRRNHPLAVLLYARQLFLLNETERLERVMGDIRYYFERDSFSESRKRELRGEYYMFLASLAYNEISRMEEYWQKASELLTWPSALEDRRASWTWGSPSVLQMYYREAGSARELTEKIHDSRKLYYKLSGRSGFGADFMLKAESEYCRGNMNSAEILAHRVSRMAGEEQQEEIKLCADFLYIRILMLWGRAEKGIQILEEVSKRAEADRNSVLFSAAELVRGFVGAVFHRPELISDWIADGDFDEKTLYLPAYQFLCVVYGKALLERGEYTRFLGESERLVESLKKIPHLLTEIYFRIYTAAAHWKIGDKKTAVKMAEIALQLAEPDGFVMPFVENATDVVPIIEEMRCGLSAVDLMDFMQDVFAATRRCKAGLSAVSGGNDEMPPGLMTKREQEIAQLVAEGKTNAEIAASLNIAEITVKKNLSNIYARLGISNRAALARIATL